MRFLAADDERTMHGHRDRVRRRHHLKVRADARRLGAKEEEAALRTPSALVPRMTRLVIANRGGAVLCALVGGAVVRVLHSMARTHANSIMNARREIVKVMAA